VLPEGVVPELARVQHTDGAEIGVFEDRLTGGTIVICTLDNLGKGAAGQAVQNVISSSATKRRPGCGFPESWRSTRHLPARYATSAQTSRARSWRTARARRCSWSSAAGSARGTAASRTCRANDASLTIPRKLGFAEEGMLRRRLPPDEDGVPRDVIVFSLFRDVFASSPASSAPVQAFDVGGERML